jgi:hypothetical protein
MSDIKHPLAYVRDVTGKIIHLGMFESAGDIKVTDNVITLAVNRAQVKETRGFGWQVTKRGITLYSFRRDERTGVWALTGTVPVWWSTDELHGQPPKVRDAEWEQMCYRPGNARNPLDNLGRQAQGY